MDHNSPCCFIHSSSPTCANNVFSCCSLSTCDQPTAALQKLQAGAVWFSSEKLLKLTKQTPPELTGARLFKSCHGSRGCVAEKFKSMLEACSRPTGGLLAPFNSFRTEVQRQKCDTHKNSGKMFPLDKVKILHMHNDGNTLATLYTVGKFN